MIIYPDIKTIMFSNEYEINFILLKLTFNLKHNTEHYWKVVNE